MLSGCDFGLNQPEQFIGSLLTSRNTLSVRCNISSTLPPFFSINRDCRHGLVGLDEHDKVTAYPWFFSWLQLH